MYLSYEDYAYMGGVLDDLAFERFEIKAEKIVDYYTCSRFRLLAEVPNEVRCLMFELIGMLASEDGKGTLIASESNDGTSVTYVNRDSQAIADEYYTAIKSYLTDIVVDGVPVLYKGVYNAKTRL